MTKLDCDNESKTILSDMESWSMVPSINSSNHHRLIIFEGVDGVGKSTLATALAKYYAAHSPERPTLLATFPGNIPGTLGEWVYRFHHHRVPDAPVPESVAAPALQLLHVAAHVDAIVNQLSSEFANGVMVILDRYWWSTYAYARTDVGPEEARSIVDAERIFWKQLPKPTIVYVTRTSSLKPQEIDADMHVAVHGYYTEILEVERKAGTRIELLSNDGSLDKTWSNLLRLLGLPFQSLT